MTDLEILMDLYDCDISQAYKYLHVTDSHFTLGVYKRGFEEGKKVGYALGYADCDYDNGLVDGIKHKDD